LTSGISQFFYGSIFAGLSMEDYNSYSEDDMLSRLRNADEKAFTEIYKRYWEKLLAIGFYHLRNKQAAEDIVHEVMTSLWARKKELAVQWLSSYRATAVKFAVFKSILRDKRRRELQQDQAVPESLNETMEKLDALFLQEYLSQTIEQLPEKSKLVFAYSRDDGLTISQIAKKMNLSPKAVEYHMTKALRSLKDTLKKIKSFFV
jgi:RNA polymerase sigma-70 factor (ECF subfamily)